MSNFNYFITSSSATIVLDAVALCDRRHSQNYWVFSRSHSLNFYKSDVVDDDTAVPSLQPQDIQKCPHFSVDLRADIVRMIKWAPPIAVSSDSQLEDPEALLLLTETCMLYLVEPDFEKRTLNLRSKLDLTVRTQIKLVTFICRIFLVDAEWRIVR